MKDNGKYCYLAYAEKMMGILEECSEELKEQGLKLAEYRKSVSRGEIPSTGGAGIMKMANTILVSHKYSMGMRTDLV